MMRDRDLIEAELSRCNKCGFCMQSCPAYRAARREVGVARGRNEIVRGMLDGSVPLDAETVAPLLDCLLCGACTTDCFGKVRTKDLVVRAREAYGAEHGRPGVQDYLFRKLLPDPQRLTRLVRAAALGKRSGLAGLAQRLGLLRWLSPTLSMAEDLVPTMPGRFLRDRLAAMDFVRQPGSGPQVMVLEPEHATGPKVLYFLGCATNFQLPQLGEAAIGLLRQGGCQVLIAPNNCCGLPAWSYGDLGAAELLVRRNVELLAALDFDLIVTDCASCSGFLKEYARLLPEDAAAQQLQDRVRDLTEVLGDLALPAPVEKGGTVTYHDPCHLARGQGIVTPPRRLLVDGAGLELLEMREADRCCGGAGSYHLSHPDLSREILGRKVSRVEGTGAEVVATACPACIIQLAWGERTYGTGRPVRHVVALLAERQGLRG